MSKINRLSETLEANQKEYELYEKELESLMNGKDESNESKKKREKEYDSIVTSSIKEEIQQL